MKKILMMLLSVFVVVFLCAFSDDSIVIEAFNYNGIVDEVPYYVVGNINENIEITSFSKSDGSNWVNSSYYNDLISFNNGVLNISKDLLDGIYDVSIEANVDDVSNSKVIRIVKTNSYDIKFNEGTVNDGDDLIYGNNQDMIINNVKSISTNVNGVEYNVYDMSDCRVTTLHYNYEENKAYLSVDDSPINMEDNILDVSKSEDYYGLTIELTHTYEIGYDGNADKTYSYFVDDVFDIVCKDAYFDLEVVDDLVYSGKEAELMIIGECEPIDSKIYFKVINEDLGKDAYSSITSEIVEVPYGKNAGRYYAYYFIDHGTNPNYKDVYGYESVDISPRVLSVSEFDSINYDGNNHRPLEVDVISMVSGLVEGEKANSVDTYIFNYIEGDDAYRVIGIWPVRFNAGNNYCFDIDGNKEIVRNLVIKEVVNRSKKVVNTMTY